MDGGKRPRACFTARPPKRDGKDSEWIQRRDRRETISVYLGQKLVENAQNFFVVAGEIEETDGVLQLAAFFGVFRDRVEDVLNVAVKLVDDAGSPDAVVSLDAAEKKIKFPSLQHQFAQTG